MEASDLKLLAHAEWVFQTFIQPNAQSIDREPIELGRGLGTLASQGLLCLRRPIKFGGPELGEAAFRRFQEMSARYSGALSFLMTQHQSAVSMISKSDNEELKGIVLPDVGETAEVLIGIGISQLRRPGKPMVHASPVEGGYRIDGVVPWLTGLGFFNAFIVGATLPDGRALFGFMPFTPQCGESAVDTLLTAMKSAPITIEQDGGSIEFSAPMRLAVFETANTVEARISNWFMPEGAVVYVKSPDWPLRNDMINIVLQGHFALGCAQAGLDQMRSGMERKPSKQIADSLTMLEQELERCRKAASEIPVDPDSETTQAKLEVRAWAIELAVRCAHAGVVVWGGASNGIDHPAQRIYREALLYSVSAQTTDIMNATLSRLARQ